MARRRELHPNPEQTPLLEFEKLILLEHPLWGIHKRVQKAKTPQGDTVAAKFFLPQNTILQTSVNQEALAREEFDAYNELSSSPRLNAYVPKAISLIKEDGAITGLAVEWKDGVPLRNLKGLWYTDHIELYQLQDALLSWSNLKFPIADMLTAENIHHGTSGFWFSACWLETTNRIKYVANVTQAIRRLSVDYVR